jgi:iron complex outermembrane receptor protein
MRLPEVGLVGRRRLALHAIAALLALVGGAAHAQRSCVVLHGAPGGIGGVPAGEWPAPLDARISLQLRDVTLADALTRASVASRVAIGYSSDLLPVDRRVCLDVDDAPLGALLAALLRGTSVEAKVVSGRAALVPLSGAPAPPVEMGRGVGTLDRVVVTGSAVAAPRRALAIGVDVIDGEELRRDSRTSLASLLDAAAPGVWLWEGAPSSVVAHYGSIRGASSFSSSYPKVYVDGIEVANPLLVTELDPDVIDRIEVIRGPQGSALYGSDAISGVINVVTRHDGSDRPGPVLTISSTAGASATAYGPGPAPTHEQRVALRGGTNLRSFGAAADFGQDGPAIPGTRSTHLLASADARVVSTRATTSVTGRFASRSAGAGGNPLFADLVSASSPVGTTSAAVAPPQSVQQYTAGASTTVAAGSRWTHTLLAGIDGYRLSQVVDAARPVPAGVDSALRPAQESGSRITLRGTSVAELRDEAQPWPLTATIGVEQSVLEQRRATSTLTPSPTGGRYPTAVAGSLASTSHNTGLFAQLGAAWNETAYLTGGLRVERNDAFARGDEFPLLPMFGIAVVHRFGGAELKLRSAAGRGIRPPQMPANSASFPQQHESAGPPAMLGPEFQSGIESGAELYLGRALAIQVTRFDQVASGLIQNVAVAMDTGVRGGMVEQHVRYQAQNVGEITNRGWEMQATLRRGPFALLAAETLVDSRVRKVADGYLGDLRAGDRMLAVPARTTSVTGSWTGARATLSVSAARAADWIDYDRLSLARAFAAAGRPMSDLVGPRLREYWLGYTGDTHLRLAASARVAPRIDLLLTGDNLLGGQRGEPDNVTIRAGRTIAGGARATF